MPQPSNDELVRQIREARRRQIQGCSARVARNIVALSLKIKTGVDVLAETIAAEFAEIDQ
jgi:hypothetical protein